MSNFNSWSLFPFHCKQLVLAFFDERSFLFILALQEFEYLGICIVNLVLLRGYTPTILFIYFLQVFFFLNLSINYWVDINSIHTRKGWSMKYC